MTDFVKLTEQKTIARFDRNTERTLRNAGHGDTPMSLKITEDCLEVLKDYIHNKLENLRETISELKVAKGTTSSVRGLLNQFKTLPTETLALCSLQGVLHCVGKGDDLRNLSLLLGRNVHGELWAAGLLRTDARLSERIEKAVRKKHAGLKQRQQAARSMAARAGYTLERWNREATLKAGGVLARWVFDALPGVFYTREAERQRVYVHVREEALDAALAAVSRVVASHPVTLPCVEPPLTWTGLHTGGFPDARLKPRVTLLRRAGKAQSAEVRAAIRAGTMQPTLDAINALQSVAWTINQPILKVMLQCIWRKIPVKGLPRPEPYPKPAHPKPWPTMTEDEQRAWRYRADKIEQQNRGLVSDRVLLAEDISTAGHLTDAERFWTPFNADWRGRVYPMSHLNFQRDDRVRALFLFADGAPIGDEGLRALKTHVANCGAFKKIDKAPIEERIAWVDKNLRRIKRWAERPLETRTWMKADTPFLFLAAAMELIAALNGGAEYVTHLPVSFDGSCSGLQHLAAATRDAETAKLVNLTPSPTPQDVYQVVADVVTNRLRTDLLSDATLGKKKRKTPVRKLAKLCLDHGIDRSVVKRATMTFAYSSKKFGMASQFKEDLMRPLEIKTLAGELSEHPFGDDNGRMAAIYLAGHVYDAIKAIVKRPAEAMDFLQTLARVLAHEGKPLRWTTPTGLPWCNAYYEPTYVRVKLWLHDAAVTLRLATGDTREIRKDKAANGVSPNAVHACDAAHLMLTCNAAVREGIVNLATVHDSFGCLAPQAVRFNQIIREQFVQMYQQHDILAEVLAQAKCDLTCHNWHRLPTTPSVGNLNIMEVNDASFAFA